MKGLLLIVVSVVALALTDACGRHEKKKTNRPPLIVCPDIPDVTAGELKTYAVVEWSEPTVFDDTDGWTVMKIRGGDSGNTFNEGAHAVSYSATDRSGERSTCSTRFYVRVIRCPVLLTPRHGDMDCDSDRLYGRTCTFSCDDGYRMHGVSSSRCQRNGFNTHNAPTCRPSST